MLLIISLFSCGEDWDLCELISCRLYKHHHCFLLHDVDLWTTMRCWGIESTTFHGKDQPFSMKDRIGDDTDVDKELRMKTNQTDQRSRFPTITWWRVLLVSFVFFLCHAHFLQSFPWRFDVSEKEKVFMSFFRSPWGSENRVQYFSISLSLFSFEIKNFLLVFGSE